MLIATKGCQNKLWTVCFCGEQQTLQIHRSTNKPKQTIGIDSTQNIRKKQKMFAQTVAANTFHLHSKFIVCDFYLEREQLQSTLIQRFAIQKA